MPEPPVSPVLSNTSPLYYLNLIGLLDILPQIYGQIITTPEVVEELVAGRQNGLQTPDVTDLDWLDLETMPWPRFLGLVPDLGKGETSLLALALTFEDPLVILDDQLARRVARRQQMRITGTLGVLAKAKQCGFVARLAPALDELVRSGFYARPELVQQVLRSVGEQP